MEWVGDARYLWARESSSARKAPRPFHILDARSMTLARTIGPSELRAAAPSLTASKLAQQSVLVAQPRRDNGPIYFSTRDDARDLGHERLLWSANPDGTGLRFVMPYWVRQWVGVAASGELVFWEPTTAGPKITLVDLATHRERLLF